MALTTTGGDASSFRQQGTMDWVAFAQAPVQFSFNVLARYSKAGIDPLTVAAGQAACTSLQIPWKAQEEILERMSKLPCMALYGGVAWFGFGLRHALLDLTDRDGGLACLTLCGCLAESFSAFYGAQVLHAFCRQQNMSSALLPGIRNWHALLKPCAGIFASSKFPNLIHGFACLLATPAPYGMRAYEATAPDALAKALIQLNRLASKHLENITITGGIDCAWLAAFAEFVLGLRIEIVTRDGAQEYCSSRSHASPSGKIQVTFLKDDAAKPEVEIARKCFILPVGRDLFKMESETASQTQVHLIRSPWTSILIDSFGEAAQALLHDPVISRDFGKILVYASDKCASDQNASDKYAREVWDDDHRGSRAGARTVSLNMQYCVHSRNGDDLLDFAAWRLPELKPVLEKATANREHQISSSIAEDAVRGLQVTCNNCLKFDAGQICSCLLDVASGIIDLISILSMTDVQELNPIPHRVRDLCHQPRHSNLHLQVRELFSAFSISDGEAFLKRPAVARNGICSFFGLLTNPNLPPMLAATVTVMPGHIEYSGSLFEMIEDLPLRTDPFSSGLLASELEPRRRFDLLISETADLSTLQAAYRSQDSSSGNSCNFTVAKITSGLLRTPPPPRIDMYTFPDKYTFPAKYRISGIDHEENCFYKNNHESDKGLSRTSQTLCVMITILLREGTGRKVEDIHKTSSDVSDEANNHELYSAYQRFMNNEDAFKLVPKVDFTYVSDCPVCILLSLDWSWMYRTPWNGGLHRLIIHKSRQPPRVIEFETVRRRDLQISEDSHDVDHENTHEKHTRTNLNTTIRTNLRIIPKIVMKTITRRATEGSS